MKKEKYKKLVKKESDQRTETSVDFSQGEFEVDDAAIDTKYDVYRVGLEKDLTTAVYEETNGCPHTVQGTHPSRISSFPKELWNGKFSKDFIKVERSQVFHFSPEQCFSLVRNYLNLLSFFLKPNQDAARKSGYQSFDPCPQWEKFLPSDLSENGPGSRFRFSKFAEGGVFSLVTEVKVCSKSQEVEDENTVYRFAVKNIDEESYPMSLAKDQEMLMVFTSFEGRIEKCHFYLALREREIMNQGFFSSRKQQERMDIEVDSYLRIFLYALRRKFSPKIPKKDSHVAIVGAGPSGLHMAHLLIEKGLPAENLTIYEKEDRIGGKTVTIPYNSDGKGEDLSMLNSPTYDKNGALIYGNRKKEDFLKGGKKINHELGTGYLSSTYFTTREFLEDLQSRSDNDDPDLLAHVGPDSYAFEGGPIKEGDAWDLTEWLHNSISGSSSFQPLFRFMPWLKKIVVPIELHLALKKYIRLQKDLMGAWHYTMPARRSSKQIDTLMMPFGDFLKENGLYKLHAVLTYALTGQGYGLLKDIPTFWAMTWLTPEQLDGFGLWRIIFLARDKGYGFVSGFLQFLSRSYSKLGLEFSDLDKPTKAMLIVGWGSVWDRVLKVNGLEKSLDDPFSRVKRSVDITSIQRKKSGKIIIRYEQNGKTYSNKHDFLVMAAPVSDAYEDPSKQTIPFKMTKAEELILLSKDIEAAKFKTTLIRPIKNGHFSRSHMRVFIDPMLEHDNNIQAEPGVGEVSLVRDTYKALQPELSTINGHLTDPARDIVREKLIYQYIGPGNKVEGKELQAKFRTFFNDYRPDMGRYEDIKEICHSSWTYFTHFGRKGLLQGDLWNLAEMQGENNTYFVHASSHFESIHHLMNYNKMIFAGLTGQLTGFEKPNDDKTIEEYQRVENFFLNPKVYPILGHLYTAFTWLLNVLWTIFYVISFPYMELYAFRTKRQQELKTSGADFVPPASNLDILTYIKHMPLFTGYTEFKDSIGDSSTGNETLNVRNRYRSLEPMHRSLRKLKPQLQNTHPKLPLEEIKYFLQCSFTDYRQIIRGILGMKNPQDSGFIDVGLKRLVGILEESIPISYSFFATWVMAVQLRFYVGFSYRFEDLKGGGLRIPNCNLLENAIKELGELQGRRFCIMSCKIPLEEKQKAVNAKVHLVPDHIDKKSGFGCTIRFSVEKENAYSDHEMWLSRTKDETRRFERFQEFDW
eukprot:snap_masked-scaffold_6-processed-gene-1.35-mRNA-1 protein AED:0.91 eAED:0.91 QI:0/-1/0/1/-1/1/1/0/1196